MMAVDAAFLFEFLQVCSVREVKVLIKVPSRLSQLVDLSGNKTALNAILRDIMMLENQISFFVVRMLAEFQFPSLYFTDELLLNMLTGLSKDLSPFKTVDELQKLKVKDCAHFLDFLYQFVVPKPDVPIEHIFEIQEGGEAEEGDSKHPLAKPRYLRQFINEIWKILSKLEKGLVEWVKRIIS